VSIPQEPVKEQYTIKRVIEYKFVDEPMQNDFHKAMSMYKKLRKEQAKTAKSLKFKEPTVVTEAQPPQSDRPFGSDMRRSTLAASQMSPGSEDFGKSSSLYMMNSSNDSLSKVSPRLTRRMTKALMAN